MYEERERFSWTSLFIKIIIVVIFVLFTIWLLSLSYKSTTKHMSNSIDVLTDKIFSENIDKMKEVGKSYFTTERLPEKVGEVKTLSLAKMYDENLILEIKDKNGNVCSAKNSYVSVEKMENEYQMKVYLECGEEKDSIKVIMGCYNYCNTDICEKKEQKEETNKAIEYQYSKTTGGSWGPWGNWTNWSTVEVGKNNYRDVDTKVVSEPYSYDKQVTESKYTGEAACPEMSGYTLVSDNDGVCSYKQNTPSTTNPICPTVSGYSFTSRNGFTCSYKQNNQSTANPTCPSVDGYTNTGRDGFTCSYKQNNQSTTNPTCPGVDGYTNTGRDGFTCSYKQNNPGTANPTCPTVSGYSFTSRSGFTCNYTQTYYVAVGTKLVSSCAGCAKEVQTVYEPRYNYTTKTASCPSGYSKSGNSCVAPAGTTTKDASCPSGYSKSGNSCVAPAGTTTKDASCPNGYSKSGNSCVAPIGSTTKNAVCENRESMKNGKCYKDVTSTVKVTGTKNVTYYRYRLRDYTGGVTDYKWSSSNNDKELLNAGYKLTGKTRNREVGGK